jgi:tetratricopeptide (TPR) repeat protein
MKICQMLPWAGPSRLLLGLLGRAAGKPLDRLPGVEMLEPRGACRVTTARLWAMVSAGWASHVALGVLALTVLLLMGGCASPFGRSSPAPPRAEGKPGGVPTAPAPADPGAVPSPPSPQPRVVPPRQSKPSAAMVASAQWVEEGISAIDVGDYQRAVAVLERAISVEPNNGRAFYYYGLAMGEGGSPGYAVTLLRKAEILLRGDRRALGDVYAQMGVNLERLGHQQEAIQRYQQALAQNPNQALAQRRLQALRG